MSSLANLFKDPPPTHAFELSEQGIAFADVADPRDPGFTPLEAGVLLASPLHDNIQQFGVVQERIRHCVPPNGSRKKRAALILPDYCARVAVLDFDAFPDDNEERLALLRFRMKKSVPFDVDSAVVSFAVQPHRRDSDGAKVEVLVAIIAAEIVARYEAPFRAIGIHPGLITTSSLAALNLIQPDDISLLVKLAAHTLSVVVLHGSAVRLARCVELDSDQPEEIESVLHPTVAYVEDELKSLPKRIWLSGFGTQSASLAQRWHAEWHVAVDPLNSRFGAPGVNNAGLLGYLESVAG
jgi:type IV pilus assembly protein PilM